MTRSLDKYLKVVFLISLIVEYKSEVIVWLRFQIIVTN